MRGSGRPAALAASRMVGAMWLSIVLGPVIHVTVPSASSPVSFSMVGPSAATSTGTRGTPGNWSPALTR